MKKTPAILVLIFILLIGMGVLTASAETGTELYDIPMFSVNIQTLLPEEMMGTTDVSTITIGVFPNDLQHVLVIPSTNSKRPAQVTARNAAVEDNFFYTESYGVGRLINCFRIENEGEALQVDITNIPLQIDPARLIAGIKECDHIYEPIMAYDMPSTCTSHGFCYYYCTQCGQVRLDLSALDPDNHTYGPWEVDEATGYKVCVCIENPEHLLYGADTTPVPTETPVPEETPTAEVTAAPTTAPTAAPTLAPDVPQRPTQVPGDPAPRPTNKPSHRPTTTEDPGEDFDWPTYHPSDPTSAPTDHPSQPTSAPTAPPSGGDEGGSSGGDEGGSSGGSSGGDSGSSGGDSGSSGGDSGSSGGDHGSSGGDSGSSGGGSGSSGGDSGSSGGGSGSSGGDSGSSGGGSGSSGGGSGSSGGGSGSSGGDSGSSDGE